MKAGLLPRLSDDVIAVYVEATAEETETRLLNGLRKRCPALPDNLGLKETLAALRRGQGIPAGKKVLIVLDQFEQWLHAKKDEENTELVQALRQCDGGRVQCIVMVRDDFWMAATRFMRDLEVRLVEGQNSAAVDLFRSRPRRESAGGVWPGFRQTCRKIRSETSKDQKQFLEQAVAGLAQEGKVISRPAGPVCRDDEGQAVDAGHAEGSGRHRRASASPSSKRRSVRPPLRPNIAITRKRPGRS